MTILDRSVSLLMINPNSSQPITDGLKETLDPLVPPAVTLTYYTGPPHGPPEITDNTTGYLSAVACIQDIGTKGFIEQFDGFLVCCFSDHPLVHILREKTSKPALGIFEAAIVHSLLIGNRFGIITTGTGNGHQYIAGVRNFFGATTDRFTGVICTGLGVVELRTGVREHVDKKMKDESAKVAQTGADVIVLGCAGMTGMEELVQQGVLDAELPPVKVVDGAKAGLQMLVSLARLHV